MSSLILIEESLINSHYCFAEYGDLCLGSSLSSGFFIGADGTILTCAHGFVKCLQTIKADSLRSKLYSIGSVTIQQEGEKGRVSAEVLAIDIVCDMPPKFFIQL